MNSRYDFQTTEDKIYQLWEKAGIFNPDTTKKLKHNNHNKTKSFSIIMPPPNANDPLHVGHALFVAIEDTLIRFHRMLGDDTLWLPGTDHAGIETQFVFEKKLKKKGQSRFNFNRQDLYNKILEYSKENSGVAIDQIKKLGASCDWSRYKFTLDNDVVEKVLETFKKLHNDGLIYRDLKLVNYCTRCGTSYSELEVEHSDRNDPLYTIQYGPLQVATVRLETIFGDVAVAVNPDDKRYQQYIGKVITVEYPWGKKQVPVIADKYVDPSFGTGVVKVTPYHDPNDYLMWTTHKDEIKEIPLPIINTNGKIYNAPKKYTGLGVVNARKMVLDDYQSYQDGKLLISINNKYQHSVGTCYRCHRPIEPLPLPQVFIKVNDPKKSLVKATVNALNTKKTVIHGAGREKILRHWLNKLKDWNISRQIVWGISMPIWYKVDGYEDKITASFINDETKEYQTGILADLLQTHSLSEITQNIQSMSAEVTVPYIVSNKPPSDNYIQETDTFDTWFSSSQWPVIAFNNKEDFQRFYPTSVMETGYDILPFWVMRMMLLNIYTTGKSPFKDVYLHGLVRDNKGQKMSKSKGNVINPLEIKKKFGADALRMALMIRSTAGQDKSIGLQDFKAGRNLSNKLWNASRFVILFNENNEQTQYPNDQVFKERLNEIIKETTKHLHNLKIGLASEYLYNEFWHWYCDVCIEDAKNKKISQPVLLEGIIVFLKLFHPFIPFVTESIWQELYQNKLVKEKLLIVSSWPIRV